MAQKLLIKWWWNWTTMYLYLMVVVAVMINPQTVKMTFKTITTDADETTVINKCFSLMLMGCI